MIWMAMLMACNGCPDADNTGDTRSSGRRLPPVTGDTGPFPDPCEDAEACWRFETPGLPTVSDQTVNRNDLTLGGDAAVTLGAAQLPSGLPNDAKLEIEADGDVAFLDLATNALSTFPDGITFEARIRPLENPFPTGAERTVAWFEGDAMAVRFREREGLIDIVARVNGADATCATELVTPYQIQPGRTACLSVTYTDGELIAYVNAVEVGSATAPEGCTNRDAVVVPATGQFQLGADDSAGDAEGDRTWRGQLDEVVIFNGALTATDLVCAEGTVR